MACYSMVQTATVLIILRCNKKVNWSGKTGWPPNGSTSQLVFGEPASWRIEFEFGLAGLP